MNEFLIAIGSNIGDRTGYIKQAISMVEARCGKITARSSLYVTEPVGAADQEFLNGAFIVTSTMDPSTMLGELLGIEKSLGRTRAVHWGNRTIDLDILMARAEDGAPVVSNTPSLAVPHPRMLERDFVLVPAAAIAGDWVHPRSRRTLSAELKDRFTDRLKALTDLGL